MIYYNPKLDLMGIQTFEKIKRVYVIRYTEDKLNYIETFRINKEWKLICEI